MIYLSWIPGSQKFTKLPKRLHAQQTTEKQRANQDQYTLLIQKEARMREAIRQGSFDKFVSIIMLSYGKEKQTLKAIEGLQRTVKIPHEIILYDNGSRPETVEFLKTHIDGKFPAVRVLGRRAAGIAQNCALYLYSKAEAYMLAVRLDDALEKRLEALAAKTGRTKTFYARAAIEAHLDDLEDFYLADERMKGFREDDAIPLEALKAELGLED